MRYAVISDIHANLEAFKAVLSDIKEQGADDIVCLGDIVGYNADPNECVDIIRSRGIRTVMGNHDSRAAGVDSPGGFNSRARDAILWTRERLTRENIEFLRALPLYMSIDDSFLIMHGSLDSYDEYIYTGESAAWNFGLINRMGRIKASFFGHTHLPTAYMEGGGNCAEVENFAQVGLLAIRPGSGYLINPGAVGQPRDGDTRAGYIIYDTDRAQVSLFKVDYDKEKTIEKITGALLPSTLANRLREGW